MKSIRVLIILFLTISHSLLIAQSNRKLILKNKDYPSKLYSVNNQTINTPPIQHLGKTQKQKNKTQNSSSTIIGNTTYDLQTTGSMPRRLISYPNGKLATAWLGSSQDSNYTDLGTRYNSFDGTQWGSIPNNRIETIRTLNGGLNSTRNGEVSIASPNAITKKSNTNTSWDTTRTEVKFENLNWPRTATVGDTIYTIFGSNSPDSISGFKAPIYFSRSIDGGITFSTPTALFAQGAGYDTINHIGNIGPDHYAIDAFGNTVAILLIGVTEDVVVLKSTNCGNTWTKKIVQEFPIHKYNSGITDTNGDGLCDTLLGVTGDGTIIIDNNSIVHVVYSDLPLIQCDTIGITIFPIYKSDYFKYWNDDEKIIVEVPTLLDLNGNGIFDVGSNMIGNNNIRYGNSGYSMHPMLASIINQNSTSESIILVYSAVNEVDTNENGLNYHGVYMIPNVGNLFSGIIDISKSVSQENVFPIIPTRMKTYNPLSPEIYIQWQQDFDPGVAVNGHHVSTINDIVIGYPTFVGIGKSSNIKNKVYPNPASHSITIDIESNLTSTATIKFINVMGQEIYSKSIALVNGINKENIIIDSFIPGLYTVLINSNNTYSSEKIIIK